MKKFIFFVFAVLVGVILASRIYYSPCDTPILYRIETVDPQFGMSQENFLSFVKDSAQIWNNTVNKNLFEYNPQGELSISLVYDERQSLTNKINQFEEDLNTQKSSLELKVQEYKNLSSQLQQKLNDFNNKVDYWNQQGGAPKDEFDKLIAEQQELKRESDSVNEIARSLNQSTNVYNTEVGNLNQTVDTFNKALKVKPEQGVYNGNDNTIDIFFSTSNQELIHTIAHELGHATGLGHVSNKKAIMYSFTSMEIVPSLEDIKILNDVCKKRTILEVSKNKLIILLSNLEKQIE